MRIVVSGATGFIGAAFVRRALTAGHEVLALARSAERAAVTLPRHPALTVASGTLAAPPWTAIARFEGSACLHAAWITQPADYRHAPENRRLLEQSLALASGLFERGVGRLVGLGTCEEYAPAWGPLEATRAALKPVNVYAKAKHELHLALDVLATASRTCLAWARVFQPYGTGEDPARLPSLVIRQVRAGERVTLHTPATVRDWVHVDDVAAALLTLVQSDGEGAFNVGTGTGHTVEHVARSIARLLGRPELIEARPSTDDGAGAYVADCAGLRRLGWAPRVHLQAGLTALIEETATAS